MERRLKSFAGARMGRWWCYRSQLRAVESPKPAFYKAGANLKEHSTLHIVPCMHAPI